MRSNTLRLLRPRSSPSSRFSTNGSTSKLGFGNGGRLLVGTGFTVLCTYNAVGKGPALTEGFNPVEEAEKVMKMVANLLGVGDSSTTKKSEPVAAASKAEKKSSKDEAPAAAEATALVSTEPPKVVVVLEPELVESLPVMTLAEVKAHDGLSGNEKLYATYEASDVTSHVPTPGISLFKLFF